MKLKILTLMLLTTILQGCQPTIKESGIEMLEKCYDGVVYVSSSYAGISSLSVKFNRDSTVSTTLINGNECR